MMSNEGFLGCYSVPNRAEPHGAVASADPKYRGEVHFEEGAGHAAVTHFSPSHAEIAYAGATPGAILVYNMNYDPSWRANGQRAMEYDHAVATRVGSAQGTVTFRYFPRTFLWGMALFVVTVGVAVAASRRFRR
jgi:hypothetical protein